MSKSEEFDLNKQIAEMASAGMYILETMKPMLEMLEGYKSELARYGYNEDQQAAMAVDLHYMVTHSLGNQVKNE